MLGFIFDAMRQNGGTEDDWEEMPYYNFFMDDRVFNKWFRPSKGYVVGLQLAFKDALKEIDTLNHTIDSSANNTLIADADQTRREYYETLKRVAILEAESEKYKDLYQFYRDQCKQLQGNISIKDEIHLEERGLSRGEDGKFEADTSTLAMPTTDKKTLAFAYSSKGWSNEAIARILKLSKAETVRQYISSARQYCRIESRTDVINGWTHEHEVVCFTCGNGASDSFDFDLIPRPQPLNEAV